MATHFESMLRTQLASRRQKLESAISSSPDSSYLRGLLHDVDAALSRMETGSYGLCETCHDTIESDRLAADPLARFCLDHLTPFQQRALEQDLQLAAKIQAALLPQNDLVHGGWQAVYHYRPAGPVSGDYCDLVAADGTLYFMLGDVSGKGVAASMLMAHLHAMFRALCGIGLPLEQLVERASRVFCESTLASQFATLVCGKASRDGDVELCNAGHLPPLLFRRREVTSIRATGLPLGVFCSEQFTVEKTHLERGDFLTLYTDGLSEAQNRSGDEFGTQPLVELAVARGFTPPRDFLRTCAETAEAFRAGAPSQDDLTLMVIDRIG